jgi:hypothetical protein
VADLLVHSDKVNSLRKGKRNQSILFHFFCAESGERDQTGVTTTDSERRKLDQLA